MGATVTNVKIVQCTIFCWNPWTKNWIRHVWNRGATNFGTRCISTYEYSNWQLVLAGYSNQSETRTFRAKLIKRISDISRTKKQMQTDS